MFIETSAIVAILLNEPEQSEFLAALENDPNPCTSVVNAVEACLGVGRETGDYGRAGDLVMQFVDQSGIEVHGIPRDLVGDVVAAYATYGKGQHHPAQLNFGDCFSYAMAKRLGQTLLYKGNDFSKIDIA